MGATLTTEQEKVLHQQRYLGPENLVPQLWEDSARTRIKSIQEGEHPLCGTLTGVTDKSMHCAGR